MLTETLAEKQAWEEEKELIANTYSFDQTVIRFDIGGSVFATSRATLEGPRASGTQLQALCSGRHSISAEDQERSTIFIDRDPSTFKYILNYLRSSKTFIPPKDPELCAQLVLDARYYAMPREMLGQVQENGELRPYKWCEDYVDEKGGIYPPELFLTLGTSWGNDAACAFLSDIVFPKGWLADGSKLNLLYASSRDGFSNATFHSRCDNQGPTLTVVEIKTGHVFGGYTPLSWNSSGKYQNDSKLEGFLFSLKPTEAKYQHYQNPGYAISCSSTYGPTFGGGTDLYLNLDNLKSSYSNLNHSYKSPLNTTDQTSLAGQLNNWDIKHVCVFEVPVSSLGMADEIPNFS